MSERGRIRFVAIGAVAEWLGRGLQSLVQRFESARRLPLRRLQHIRRRKGEGHDRLLDRQPPLGRNGTPSAFRGPVVRSFEAGSDGLAILAFGEINPANDALITSPKPIGLVIRAARIVRG